MVDWNVIGVKICRSIGPDLNKQTGLTDRGSSFPQMASHTQNGRKRKKFSFFMNVYRCFLLLILLVFDFIFLHKFFSLFSHHLHENDPYTKSESKSWSEDDWFFDTRRNWEELIVASFEKTFFFILLGSKFYQRKFFLSSFLWKWEK